MLEFKYTLSKMIDDFINARFMNQIVCPHCSCTYIVLYGKNNGRQRYLCKSCGKTFRDFTNTPLAMTHFPEKWGAFMECTLKGMSLRTAAKELKVSYVTLFYWRHKLLTALKEIKSNKMKGTVELQNFYLKYSQKGQKGTDDKKRVHDKSMSYFNIESDKVCVLAAMDLFQNIFSRAVCRGHIKISDVEKSISSLLSRDNIVYSRHKHIFTAFLRRMHIKESERASDDSNTVTQYMKNCMDWMRRFRGVATKYLNNYLSLYKFLKSTNVCEILAGVQGMIAAITSVNIRNTYMSIRNDKLCINN
jgi:transposase-like protein